MKTILIKELFGIKRSEKTILVSPNPNQFCNRLYLKNQVKHPGIDTNRFDNKISAIGERLLKYKGITVTQHKKLFFKI